MVYLIGPSNYFLMPYMKSYIEILESNRIKYKIIYWDRLHKNESVAHSTTYRDKYKKFERNLKEYFKYYIFIIKNLISLNKENKIIVFSPQLLPIKLLLRNDFLIDVRDYHSILNYKSMKRLIKKAEYVVISSEKYGDYIEAKEIVINHNFKKIENDNFELLKKKVITIANIGAIRDFEANKNFINIFKNDNDFCLYFHGEGPDLEKLQDYVTCNGINNVHFTGKYEKEDEKQLYLESDVINLVRDTHELNNKIAIPNRLYNAANYNRPVITNTGTYLSEVVDHNRLGITFKDIDSNTLVKESVKNTVTNYKALYPYQKAFLEKCLQDNVLFEEKILEFLR